MKWCSADVIAVSRVFELQWFEVKKLLTLDCNADESDLAFARCLVTEFCKDQR